ncbi:MAG TPA: hypothetical protein VI759_01055 [Dehalococcoidia bacterium]|nr:hypothetical protein [Dehalococcoidia bacterium]
MALGSFPRRLTGIAGSSTAKAGFWSLSDNALISATSFATTLVLARSLSTEQFGAFVIAYTALAFVNGLQSVLVLLPHNVLAAALEGEEYEAYTASLASTQVALAALLAMVALAVGGVASIAGAGFAPLAVALAAAVFAWQLQDFVRRVQYTRGRTGEAFSYDLISYGLQVVALIALWRLGELTAVRGLYIIAATSSASFGYAYLRMRLRFAMPARAMLRRNWSFSGWLMAENVASWLSMQLLPLIAAAIIGVSAAGVWRAVLNLIAPSNIVLNALGTYALPRSAKAAQQGGRPAMLAFMLPVSAAAGGLLVSYWLLISLSAHWLLPRLYGESYGGYAPLVWVLCICYAGQLINHVQWIGLVALGKTRAMFAGRLVAVAFTFTGGLWLTWQFGLYGAAAGAFCAHMVLMLVLVQPLLGRRDEASVPEPRGAGLVAGGSEL